MIAVDGEVKDIWWTLYLKQSHIAADHWNVALSLVGK